MQGAQPRLRHSGVPDVPPAVRAWWFRLLDGAQSWGSFDAMAGRYGLRRYRLIVFRPGISAADRRLLRLWHGWPLGGATVTMLAVILLGDPMASIRTTLLVAAAVYLTVGAVLFVLTAAARADVRSMSLVLLANQLGPDQRRRYAEWEGLVCLLTRAEDLLKAGAIDLTQHEALWWQAYDRLEECTRA